MYFAQLICRSSETTDEDGGGSGPILESSEGGGRDGDADVLCLDLVAGVQRILAEEDTLSAMFSFSFVPVALRSMQELTQCSMRSLVRSSDTGGTKYLIVSVTMLTSFSYHVPVLTVDGEPMLHEDVSVWTLPLAIPANFRSLIIRQVEHL